MSPSEVLQRFFRIVVGGERTNVVIEGGETPCLIASAPGVSVEVTAFGNLDSLPGQVSVSGEAWRDLSRAQAGLILHR